MQNYEGVSNRTLQLTPASRIDTELLGSAIPRHKMVMARRLGQRLAGTVSTWVLVEVFFQIKLDP